MTQVRAPQMSFTIAQAGVSGGNGMFGQKRLEIFIEQPLEFRSLSVHAAPTKPRSEARGKRSAIERAVKPAAAPFKSSLQAVLDRV